MNGLTYLLNLFISFIKRKGCSISLIKQDQLYVVYKRQSDSEKLNVRDGERYVRRTEIMQCVCEPNIG